MLHELARFGARLLGPPPPDALEPGWLVHALDLALSPLCRGSRIAFRVGDEEASLVDCTATPGIAEDYDVLVETDATGFYHLVVDRQLEGVRDRGRRRRARAAARRLRASLRAASRLSTSQASRTSSSVVRALPTASRSE